MFRCKSFPCASIANQIYSLPLLFRSARFSTKPFPFCSPHCYSFALRCASPQFNSFDLLVFALRRPSFALLVPAPRLDSFLRKSFALPCGTKPCQSFALIFFASLVGAIPLLCLSRRLDPREATPSLLNLFPCEPSLSAIAPLADTFESPVI